MKKEREKVDIFMPIFIGDYLGDTMHLGAEGNGAYFFLLMHAWKHDGRLTTDQEQLRVIARVDPRRWPQVWGTIARFFEVDDGALVQRRLTKELGLAMGRRVSAVANGKRSAAARKAAKEAQQKDSERSTGVATGAGTDGPAKVPTDGNSSPSPSQSENPSEGVPPLHPKPSGLDPLTVHGLIHAVRVAVEKAHLEIGMYNPGQWATKAAREFLEAIPAERRNDRTRDEIRRRATAFAASQDQWIAKSGWKVEAFCERYNTLTAEQPRRDPVLEASVAKSGGRPYLPPEKAVASGS